MKTLEIVDGEQLRGLRAALEKLDPAMRKTWLLEIYERRNGVDLLATIVDIKTGKTLRREKRKGVFRDG